MIGPLPVHRVLLCTGPPDSALARYAAARLAQELPGTALCVFHQTGYPACPTTRGGVPLLSEPWHAADKPDPSRVPVPSGLKERYWSVQARWRRWGLGVWRWVHFVRCVRRVNVLLRPVPPPPRAGVHERTVMSVNHHFGEVKAFAPDVLLILGGGKIASEILATARVALNIHTGRLPEYRGVWSVLFALAAGHPEHVGVTLHVAEPALDAGRIVRWQPVAPPDAPSMADLIFALYRTGVDLAVETIRRLPQASIETSPQVGRARRYRLRDLDAAVIRAAYRFFRTLRCESGVATHRPVAVPRATGCRTHPRSRC